MASFESQLQDAHIVAASLEDATILPGEPDAKKLLTRDLRDSPSSLSFVEAPSPGDQAGLAQFVNPAPKPTASETKSKKKPPRRATAESPNVCFECKTTDSKLWRRGPDGHLMCNACGLRWRRSNKAKDAPKSTPRKRKLPSATSVSPQSPQPMSLPQSSMAAQRGGMMNNSFGTTPGMYAPMTTTNQNFGQLQYQPQNMYLHQQQIQAQYRQRQQQQHHQQIAKKDDPQIDPALMADETIASGGIDPSLQDLPHSGLLSPHNGDTINKTGHANGSISGPINEHTPNLTHSSHLNQQVTQDPRHSLPQHLQNLSQMHANRVQSIPQPSGMHTPISQTTSLIQNHDPDQNHISSDAGQNEDFSQLLSLKAFVDDAGRHY